MKSLGCYGTVKKRVTQIYNESSQFSANGYRYGTYIGRTCYYNECTTGTGTYYIVKLKRKKI